MRYTIPICDEDDGLTNKEKDIRAQEQIDILRARGIHGEYRIKDKKRWDDETGYWCVTYIVFYVSLKDWLRLVFGKPLVRWDLD